MSAPPKPQKLRETLLALGVITTLLCMLGGTALGLRHKFFEASEFRKHITAGTSEDTLRTSAGKPIWEFGPGDEAKLIERLKSGSCEPLPTQPIDGKTLVYVRSFATYLIVYLDQKGNVTSVFTSQT